MNEFYLNKIESTLEPLENRLYFLFTKEISVSPGFGFRIESAMLEKCLVPHRI